MAILTSWWYCRKVRIQTVPMTAPQIGQEAAVLLKLGFASTETVTWPYFVDEFDPPPPRRLGRGLTEYVLRSGRPALVTPEVDRALATSGEVELTGEPALHWLGAPLIAENRVIGALVVQSYTAGMRYGERELELLRFVSTQILLMFPSRRGTVSKSVPTLECKR